MFQVLVSGLELVDLGFEQLVLGVDGLDRACYLAQVRFLGLVLLVLQFEAFVDLCERHEPLNAGFGGGPKERERYLPWKPMIWMGKSLLGFGLFFLACSHSNGLRPAGGFSK